jgi:hypothetical protein
MFAYGFWTRNLSSDMGNAVHFGSWAKAVEHFMAVKTFTAQQLEDIAEGIVKRQQEDAKLVSWLLSMESNHVHIIGIYQHYKGKLYLVLGTAQHSETQEALVVYVPLYMHAGHGMSVRPLDMFLESVDVDGVSVPRFEYIGKALM